MGSAALGQVHSLALENRNMDIASGGLIAADALPSLFSQFTNHSRTSLPDQPGMPHAS